MKRLSWKYMAGLIDGEGCIDMQVGRHKKINKLYVRPRLRITLTGEGGYSIIHMFIANFGGSLDKKGRDQINPNWLPAYAWQLTGQPALRAFLQNIVNHLILKKEQAKFAIWWIDKMSGRQLSEMARQCARDELKVMKRDPQRLSERATRHVMEVAGDVDAIVQPIQEVLT